MPADDLHRPPRRGVEQRFQVFRIGRGTGPRRERHGERRRLLAFPGRVAFRAGRRRLSARQRLAPECHRFRPRLDLHFAAQDPGAGGELADRIGRPAMIEVQPREIAVRFLRERVMRHRPLQGIARRHLVATCPRRLREPPQHPERDIVQPHALGGEPVREACLAQRQAVEQRPAIEPRRRVQRIDAPALRPFEEIEGVHGEPAGGESHALTRGEQDVLAQRGPDRGEALAQAVPCLRLAAVAPEQPDESLAAARRAAGQGNDGEQGFGLAGGKRDATAIGPIGLETTQQADLGSGHRGG